MIFLWSHLLAWSKYRFDLFINALDKYSKEEARVIMKYFKDLLSLTLAVNVNLNICIASHHYLNISVAKYNKIIIKDKNKKDIY
jgi:hypothetical protein